MGLKQYWIRFGSGNPSDNSGLAPTFITFCNSAGATLAPPSISEPLTGSGLYMFQYQATQSVAFVCDGATSALSDSNRYIVGVLDPQDQLSDLVGDNDSSYGTDSSDPTTLFGFLKRSQENFEGDNIYTKSSGAFKIYTRGQSQILASKTVSDSSSEVSKT